MDDNPYKSPESQLRKLPTPSKQTPVRKAAAFGALLGGAVAFGITFCFGFLLVVLGARAEGNDLSAVDWFTAMVLWTTVGAIGGAMLGAFSKAMAIWLDDRFE